MVEFLKEAAGVVPSERQLAWFDIGFYAFIHFGVNTFTDREWGDGTEPESIFNPEKLDCRQWAETVKAAGMKGMVLTAKHHDGFCLWPSKYTEHSVKNSPCKRDGGRGCFGLPGGGAEVRSLSFPLGQKQSVLRYPGVQ